MYLCMCNVIIGHLIKLVLNGCAFFVKTLKSLPDFNFTFILLNRWLNFSSFAIIANSLCLFCRMDIHDPTTDVFNLNSNAIIIPSSFFKFFKFFKSFKIKRILLVMHSDEGYFFFLSICLFFLVCLCDCQSA